MGFKLSDLVTDREKTEKGVWCEFAAGLRFRIASAAQPAFREWLAKHAVEYRRAGDLNGHHELEREKIVREGAARYLLKDWEELLDDDGEPIPYSLERARELLEQSEEVYQFVDVKASQLANYRASAEEEAAKN